ncbi:MAG: MBL fold metallo-hydrolase [Myxococcales bacterium]|nr:MBL fold metallo-hydrolase [Myxococcales bacterium]
MRILPIEGNTQRLDGGAMYGNAPRMLWQDWSAPDDKHRIDLACRAMLLETDDAAGGRRRILFEAGIGVFFEPKLRERFGVVEDRHVLLDNLAAHGVAPGDVDAVVLSHLHFDHAGGLLSAHGDGPPRLVFERATHYVGAAHWARAKAPHPRDKASFIPVLHELLEASGRLRLVGDDGASDLAPLVRFRFSNGHTPGLMLAEIALADGPLVFAADLVPGMPWVHVPITMGYDRNAELLIDEKRALYEALVPVHGKLFFTHDPKTACGALRLDGQKYKADPVDCATLR